MSLDIEKYLAVPYVDGGRTMAGGDCWFLTCAVREEMGLPGLPSLGGTTRHTPLAMAHEYERVSAGLEVCEPCEGAIAAVFRGKLMIHVGVVVTIDGRLAVLETNPASGPRWMWTHDFIQRYFKVIFYRDHQSLSERPHPRS